ncbi:MAG: glycosyltransferase, partial [bacterium]|nr:glycosyltransferase [bacterium]
LGDVYKRQIIYKTILVNALHQSIEFIIIGYKSSMNILVFNSYDTYGGAEKIACNLVSVYGRMGHNVRLVVSRKFSKNQPLIIEIPQSRITTPIYRIFTGINQFYTKQNIIKKLLRQMEQPGGLKRILTGTENGRYVDFNSILSKCGFKPEIIHFHNLRGDFPDIKILKYARAHSPIVITMHDLWLLTGKCIQPGTCKEWLNECQDCPETWFPSFIVKNGIKKNLRKKKRIMLETKPYICVPSFWALDLIKKSYIAEFAAGLEVIHNGVNLSIFKPGDKKNAREKLRLPQDSFILFTSGRELKTNKYKNFRTLQKISILLAGSITDKKIILVCLGDKGKKECHENLEIRFIPITTDDNIVADIYRSADLYVSTSKFETWGLTITEAMACGTPVIAFRDGGIKEQIIDGRTGFLIPDDDLKTMVQKIKTVIGNKILLQDMSEMASKHAKENFGIEKTAQRYLDLYGNILNEAKKNRN